MIYEKNKIIGNKYRLLEDYYVTGYIVNYVAEFENKKYYLSEFIDKNLIENETALKHYDENYTKFWEKINFLKTQSLKEIPKVVEIIQEEKELVVYEKVDAQNINDYIKKREKNFTYKEAYRSLKKYFLSLDIAARKNIFFEIEKFTLINEMDEVFIDIPFDLRLDKDKTIKAMANLYYKLITGISFYETLKRPSEFGIVIPEELEVFLEEVLLDKISFFSVESFNNGFRDLVEFSELNVSPKNKNNEEVVVKKGKMVFGCLIISIIILIIVAIFVIGILLITKVELNNSPNTSYEEIYEILDNTNLNTEFFYNYNLDYEDVNLEGMICETDDYLFYNLYKDGLSNLYKENKQTGEIEIIFKNIMMNYMTIHGDKIYFANGTDNYKLYSIKTDGSNLTSLTNSAVSYIQIESNGNILYYVTNSSDKTPSIRKKNLKLKTDEIYEEDFALIKKYLDMYDVFKKFYIDKSVGIYFEPKDFMYNIRAYKNNMIGIQIYSDGDTLVYINSKGESDIIPFNINALEFEIMNERNIIYIDYDTGEIRDFNLDTSEFSNIYEEVYSIVNVTDNYIFAVDKKEEFILKLSYDEGSENKKALEVEKFDINYN